MYEAVDDRMIAGPAQLATPIPVVAEEFRFQNQRVRVAYQGDMPLIVAKDLAPVLGYQHARSAVRNHVARRDRYGVLWEDPMGRTQMLTAVNESGVYALIIGSTKPEARAFRQWLTAEVLPAVRKTGRYVPETVTVPLLPEITRALRGRGAAKDRQVNRVIAHRDGKFSIRVGRHWMRRIPTLGACDLPKSHALREGLALGDFQTGSTTALIQ
jgi:hypothetical protein